MHNGTNEGFSLANLPAKYWILMTQSSPISYYPPDPGTAHRVGCIFEKVRSTTYYPNRSPKTVLFVTNVLPVKHAEIAIRYILGVVGLLALSSIVYPLNFVAKAFRD